MFGKRLLNGQAQWINLLLILLLAASLAGAYPGSACQAQDQPVISVLINGEPLAGSAPVVISDRVLVPLDQIAAVLLIHPVQMDAEGHFDLKRGDQDMVLFLEHKTALINDRETSVDVPATSFGSTVYVPLRLVAEGFGAEVSWDNATNSVLVSDEPSLYLQGVDAEVVTVQSAATVNQWWESRGYTEPPYESGTKVVEAALNSQHTFGRVYDGQISGEYGGWLMNIRDLEALTPAMIRNGWALPAVPQYRVDVILDSGTHFHAGLAAPVQGWGDGGMIQFDLMGQKVGNFINPRPLNN